MKKRIISVLLCLCLIVALLPVTALANNDTYLALGDSISTGYAPNGKVDSPFANQIASNYGYDLTNEAQDGETAESLLAKLNSGTISVANYDLITITIGGNDLMNALYEYLAAKYNEEHEDSPITADALKAALANPLSNLEVVKFAFENVSGFTSSGNYTDALDKFSDNLSGIIAKIRETNSTSKIIVATQYDPYRHLTGAGSASSFVDIDALKDTFNTGVQALNAIIKDQQGIEIADVYAAFQTTGGVLTNASLSSPMTLDFHPNQEGHDLIAETIGALLGPATTASMSVTPNTDVTFSAQTVGYVTVEPKEFTIKNTGTTELENINVTLGGTDSGSFTLTTTDTENTLSADAATTFTVAPATGLTADTYNATVTVSATGVTSVTVNVSFTVNPATPTGTHRVLDENNAEIEDSPFASLSAALSAANGHAGYTVVMGSDDTLPAAIPDGVTLRVPSGIELTAASPASLLTGTLEIEAGATFVLNGENFVGASGDTSARVQLTSGSIVWKNGTLTLTEDSKATVPSGKTLSLMASVEVSGNKINTPLNAVIEKGATFTVADGGTVKAVSGNVGSEGSKVTVNGTLDVQGAICVALKASVEVADGGVLNLANLDATDIVGSGDGTGIKGDIVFKAGSKLAYTGNTVIGADATNGINITSGKATLNLSKIDMSNLQSSYIDLTVEGDVNAFGDINTGLNTTFVSIPTHVAVNSGTVTIEENAAVNLLGGSQLTLEDGAALNVKGTLEVQSNAAFTGEAAVAGTVYVFGYNSTNVTNATFNLSSGAVYALADISDNVPGAIKVTGTFEYTSISSGNTDPTTFTNKWSIVSDETMTPASQVFDRNIIGTTDDVEYYIIVEAPSWGSMEYDKITSVVLVDKDGVKTELDEDEFSDYPAAYADPKPKLFVYISPEALADLAPGEYTVIATMGNYNDVDKSKTASAKLIIPETYKVIVKSDPDDMGYFFCNDLYTDVEYYVVQGEEVTVEPMGGIGYHFDHWVAPPETPDEDGVLTFTPTENTTLTAVFKENTYAADIDPDSLDFGKEYVGYDEIDEKTVTITNNSDTPVAVFKPETDAYVITAINDVYNGYLDVGESLSFTIRPATGLEPGVYDASLKFGVYELGDFPLEPQSEINTYSGFYGEFVEPRATAELDVKFTVLAENSGAPGTQLYFTLKFETNGGKEITSLRVPAMSTVDLSKYTTERSGFRFAGWYSDKELTERIESVYMDKSKTVYAGWNPYEDVNEGQWFYDAALYNYYNGLMDGVETGKFGPNLSVTRAMMVTILWRMEGRPVVNYAMSFEDVAEGAWYTEAVRWAAANGIVNGVSETRFAPNDPITREQMAAILYRYAKYCGIDVSVGEDTNILSYKDFDEISEYAIPAFQWACGAGVMSGRADGFLQPKAGATRAEVAQLIMNFLQLK